MAAVSKSRIGPTLEELQKKRAEIAGLIAAAMGLGALEDLPPKDREMVEEETDDAIDRWSEAEHEADVPLSIHTPLQRLLAEYSELESQQLGRGRSDLPRGSGD